MQEFHPVTILIVDDDPGLLRLVDKTLKREGFATAAMGSAAEALAWLQQNSASLMLLDLKLQDFEGKELINRLAAMGRSIPFIVITGQGDERVAVEMMKRGALDYLVKDVQFIEFVPTVVRRALTQIERNERLALAEQRRKLHYDTALILAESVSLAEAMQKMLQAICESFGWRIGEAWNLDPDAKLLRNMQTWPSPSADTKSKEWIQLTERLRFAPGEGIPGRVWSSGQPLYIPDLAGDTNFPRAKLAEKLGLRSTFGFPIVLRNEVLGVMVFFGESSWSPDEDFFDCFAALGSQIGQFIERKQLERELLEISDREQHRIGRDLHDGLGQQLTALEFFSVNLADDLRKKAPKLVPSVEKISEHLREAIRQTRALAAGLSPVFLNVGGLASGLQKLAESTSAMAKVDCAFVSDAPVAIQDTARATHLYRIAQEAVNNALKHGRTGQIRITLSDRGQQITLEIADQGQGFSISSVKEAGMGLRVMKYRAELIGARLQIDSAPRKGTRVTVRLPKPHEKKD